MTSDQQGDDGPRIEGRLVPPTEFSSVPSFYSNYVQVGMSPHDFVLHFSRYSLPIVSQEPVEPRSIDIVPQPIASVSIPLNLLRGLVRALEGQAANWEKVFREPVPGEPSPEPKPIGNTPASGRPAEEVEQR